MSDQPQAGELTYTRVFDAPRELVFRCMTEPEHLTQRHDSDSVKTPPMSGPSERKIIEIPE